MLRELPRTDGLVKVRTRLPLMWAKQICLVVSVGSRKEVVELDVVIASRGWWEKITASSGESGGWRECRFGPFVVGLRPASSRPASPARSA